MSDRDDNEGREYVNSDDAAEAATPKNDMVVSPDDGVRTPPITRIMSSHNSLAGEDIVMSSRRSSDQHSFDNKKRYSLQDVLDYTPKESEEEAIVMNQIESQYGSTKSPPRQTKDTLLPHIREDRVQSFYDLDEDDIPYLARESHESRSKTESEMERRESNTMHNLTKRLMEGSMRVSTRHSSFQRLVNTGASIHNCPSTGHHQRTPTSSPPPKTSMYAATETLFGSADETKRDESPDVEAQRDEAEHRSLPSATATPTRRRKRICFRTYRKKITDDIVFFAEFIGSHNPSIGREFFYLLQWIMVPSLATATLLFYGLGNPPHHEMEDSSGNSSPTQLSTLLSDDRSASLSWWFLFIGVRQVITLDLARISQLVVVDFLVYRTKIFPRILGPTIRLIVGQSRGWPCILFFWAMWDFALLYGDTRFAKHWAYWQDWIGMFNEQNPSGGITHDHAYEMVLIFAIGISVAASLKRTFLGLSRHALPLPLFPPKSKGAYRRDMERILKQLVIIGEVAALSLTLIDEKKDSSSFILPRTTTPAILFAEESEAAAAGTEDSSVFDDAVGSKVPNENNPRSSSAEREIYDMLEQWEEPELEGQSEEEVTMATILYFRNAQQFIADEYPFTRAFGSVRTREQCIECAQDVFTRFTKGSSSSIPMIDFTAICTEATLEDGQVDRARVKEYIRVFRPNRNGQLSKLDFVKSIDSVYKRLRLLLASIKNSSQIDAAYGKILDVVFFIAGFLVFLSVIGADVNSFIIGLSGVTVSLAFMIGSASSNYIEGILFVLARKPFDIGDRVKVHLPTDPADGTGCTATWIVEKVDLYTSTLILGATGEVTTFCNGSLARMRIMNLKRSEKPTILMSLRFGVETTVHQIQEFRTRITSFIMDRPREWIKLIAFRVSTIEADLGYVEYVLIVQHRESWQSLPCILQSRSDIFSYALELQAELNMQYKAPRLPIDLRHVDSSLNKATDESSRQFSSFATMEDKKEK